MGSECHHTAFATIPTATGNTYQCYACLQPCLIVGKRFGTWRTHRTKRCVYYQTAKLLRKDVFQVKLDCICAQHNGTELWLVKMQVAYGRRVTYHVQPVNRTILDTLCRGEKGYLREKDEH